MISVRTAWERWRLWGVYELPDSLNGWRVPKTAWLPPVVLFIPFLILRLVDNADFHDNFGWVIFLGVPWAVIVTFAYEMYVDTTTTYKLTQDEAHIAAGMTNIYQCPNFERWLDLHGLQNVGIIRFDYETGHIFPGYTTRDAVKAKRGLPQITRPCRVSEDYHWYNGPTYQRIWLEYTVRFGHHPVPPPATYGIPPSAIDL